MRTRYITMAAVTATAFFISCKKIVTLKLDNTAAQIAIVGEVTNAAGPYTVTINQSVNFYADNNFPAVSGAVVKISDDRGVTDSLTETATPGVYATHVLQGRVGGTYTLSIVALNNKYSAVSTMPASVPLDSVTFNSSSTFNKKQINATANFQDPLGVKNYYQFTETINGQLFTKDIFVNDDRLSDGKYISQNLRMDSSYLKTGDVLQVKMYSIDENNYNYFYQLAQSSSTGAFNTTASPANPSTNISGGALGYFSAHTTQTKQVVVP